MAITIIKQPTNITALVNETVSFSVVAEGEGLTYRWYYSSDKGVTWQTAGMSGMNTAIMSGTADMWRNGYMYRCHITDANGDIVISNEILLTILESLPERGSIDLAVMSDIADAIREKTGKTDRMQPTDMATEIGNIESNSKEVEAFINRNFTKYTNDKITSIGNYAFAGCVDLTSVALPECTNIGSSTFLYCQNLFSVSLPKCTTIGDYAFASCNNLTTISFPTCTNLGSYAFAYCSSLTTISLPVCTTIGSNAFASCPNLTTVSLPACTSINNMGFLNCTKLIEISLPNCLYLGSIAFSSCNQLISVYLPKCEKVQNYAFHNCIKLTEISLPSCLSLGSSAFSGCTKLAAVSLSNCKYIGSGAFSKCYNLSSLTLGPSCSLAHSSVFYSTPYAGYKTSFSGTPYIYVPSSRLSWYKSATYWSKFSSYFVGY